LTGTCPRIVIAGTESGVGKTSLAAGLVRALRGRGLRVQPFKVGPDFLDPTYLALAAGRTCYNLDGWMTDQTYVRQLFRRATADADLAVIEGVMGLYDGAHPATLEGSTAEVAIWLNAPVLLVANAHGVARSLAATVKGFVELERCVGICGVIANRSGSETHRAWLAEALLQAGLPPLLGAVPRSALPELKSRHLGLVAANTRDCLPETAMAALAAAVEKHVEVGRILALAQMGAASPANGTGVPAAEAHEPARDAMPEKNASVRIGYAKDDAFHFYYPDNLEALARQGAELLAFSPLADRALPAELQGIYLGGGYPEEHAAALSANADMLGALRAFCASGRPVYAECGGLMYLARELTTAAGGRFPMLNVFPASVRMLGACKAIGYAEVTLEHDSLWGRRGSTFRGHEFHYSEMDTPLSAESGWRTVYSVRRRSGRPAGPEGFQKGRVLASYVHGHFASHPTLIAAFLRACRESA